MKKIILLILFGLSCAAVHAQTGELYFSITPIVESNYKKWTDGIYTETDTNPGSLYKSQSIFYNLKSVAKGIDISFAHINYNTAEMVKRNLEPKWNSTMEIKTTDVNLANRVNIYNLDSFFKAKSRDELIDWFDSLDVHNKKIYFFDSRDIAKGKITLIQVKLLDYGGRY